MITVAILILAFGFQYLLDFLFGFKPPKSGWERGVTAFMSVVLASGIMFLLAWLGWRRRLKKRDEAIEEPYFPPMPGTPSAPKHPTPAPVDEPSPFDWPPKWGGPPKP